MATTGAGDGDDQELTNGDNGADPRQPAELELGDDDVRLPWLEADDDDEDVAGPGTGQLLGLVLLGLLVLAVVGAGVWWLANRDDDPELVADGGVIKAPAEPYKQRPDDPGGKTFQGTGDTSFAISKGQTRPARLEEQEPPEAAAPAPASKASAPAAATAGGVGVQIGAYSRPGPAEEGWTRLSQQYELLSGLPHRVVEGRADIGTVYRLQAVTPDVAAARALCGKLKAAGLACQVKN